MAGHSSLMGQCEALLKQSSEDYANRTRMLYTRKDHADVVLVCGDGKQFHAHKAILCTHSEFFSKAFQPDRFIQGTTGQISLENWDSEVVGKLLDYFYTATYDTTTRSATEKSELMLHAKIYVAADFFAIPTLQSLAHASFEMLATDICSRATFDIDLEELPSIYEYIYDNTTSENGPGLRSTALRVLLGHARLLFNRHSNLQKDFEEIMARRAAFGAEFGIAMLKFFIEPEDTFIVKRMTMLETWRGYRKFRCSSCLHTWARRQESTAYSFCPDCGVNGQMRQCTL